jgi:prepilin-type N-terminal cleavage/methylation domain-containing protein
MFPRKMYVQKRVSGVGFTLIELLIVMSIVTLLTAIALPTLRNSLREQRVSRAAGLVQQYIREAQARAISSGVPAGVIIERSGADQEVNRCQATQLRISTTPAPYTGDLGNDGCVLRYFQYDPQNPTNPNPPDTAAFRWAVLTFRPTTAPLLSAVVDRNIRSLAIKVGDLIQLGNDRIPRTIYRLQSEVSLNNNSATYVPHRLGPVLDPASGYNGDGVEVIVRYQPPGWDILPYPITGVSNLPYAIVREPTPSFANPLSLPEQTVIDLSCSGVGVDGVQFSPLEMEETYERTRPTPPPRIADKGYNPSLSKAFNANLLPTDKGDYDRDYQDVQIVFNPDGSIKEVRMGVVSKDPSSQDTVIEPTRNSVLSDVYLLVGRTGQVLPDALLTDDQAGRPNLFDDQAIWVCINRMSGHVYTESATPPDLNAGSIAGQPTFADRVAAAVGWSRQFVKNHGVSGQ